jgi:hypothetical protein
MGGKFHPEIKTLLGFAFLWYRLTFSLKTIQMKPKHFFQIVQGFRQVPPVVSNSERRNLGYGSTGLRVAGYRNPII